MHDGLKSQHAAVLQVVDPEHEAPPHEGLGLVHVLVPPPHSTLQSLQPPFTGVQEGVQEDGGQLPEQQSPMVEHIQSQKHCPPPPPPPPPFMMKGALTLTDINRALANNIKKNKITFVFLSSMLASLCTSRLTSHYVVHLSVLYSNLPL